MTKRKYKGSDFYKDATIKCDHCDYSTTDAFENVGQWEGVHCPDCGSVMILPADVLAWRVAKLACEMQACMLNFLPAKTAARIFENTKYVKLDTKDMADR